MTDISDWMEHGKESARYAADKVHDTYDAITSQAKYGFLGVLGAATLAIGCTNPAVPTYQPSHPTKPDDRYLGEVVEMELPQEVRNTIENTDLTENGEKLLESMIQSYTDFAEYIKSNNNNLTPYSYTTTGDPDGIKVEPTVDGHVTLHDGKNENSIQSVLNGNVDIKTELDEPSTDAIMRFQLGDSDGHHTF